MGAAEFALGWAMFALASLFVVSLFAAVMPLALRQKLPPSHPFFRISDAFAAGVLVAAAMVHLLPDAAESLPDNFPFTEALAVVGAGLMYALDVLTANTSSSYILATALGGHSVLEGLALGAAAGAGRVALFSEVYLAIALHKAFAAFALGATLAADAIPKREASLICLAFAAASPVAAIAALIVVRYAVAAQQTGVVTGALTSLSAGVFLYIAFAELLHKRQNCGAAGHVLPNSYGAINDPKDPSYRIAPDPLTRQDAVLRVSAFAVGAAGMSILAIWS